MIRSFVPKLGSNTGGFRHYKEFDDHEFVIAMSDAASGLKAYVAVHSSRLGLAHGGTRMKTYDSEEEALRDALNLSRAMSYKSALTGLPYGGAKGVIIHHKDADRKNVLRAYAERVDALNGLFHTGTDVGLTDADTAMMSEHSRFILGLPKGHVGQHSTSSSAAKGVFYAIQAAARHRYGTDDLKNRTIGVKGTGKLGGELVRLLAAEGANVLISDTDEARVQKLAREYPNVASVGTKDIHKQKMDIYAPCAFGNEFTPAVIKTLTCDIVAGGANNQLPSEKAGDALFAKGILYVPDYVANAGGLIFVCEDLEKDGFHAGRLEKRLKNIKHTVKMILERSEQDGVPTHRTADALARERINEGGL